MQRRYIIIFSLAFILIFFSIIISLYKFNFISYSEYSFEESCDGCKYPYGKWEEGRCFGIVSEINKTVESEDRKITTSGTRCLGIKVYKKFKEYTS
ncbi:hypothetical protein ACFLZX_03025 [Nanoarchaeota archaeon]